MYCIDTDKYCMIVVDTTSLTLAGLPASSHFLTRPQLVTCLDPPPMGRDISPTRHR
jgi:hypothetical protein